MATRILIFSIVLGAKYSFDVKSIATYSPQFLGYNNSVLAIAPPFQNDIVNGRPPVLAPYRESLFVSYKGPAGFCIKKAC